MKRFSSVALLAGAVAAALLGTQLFARQAPPRQQGTEPCCAVKGCCQTGTCCQAAGCCQGKECCAAKGCCQAAAKARPKTDEELVAELHTILETTKSKDTFLLTVLALGRLNDKSELPAVIRNAERLGVVAGLADRANMDNPSPVVEVVIDYLGGQLAPENMPAGHPYGCPAPPAFAAGMMPPPPMPMPPPTAGMPFGAYGGFAPPVPMPPPPTGPVPPPAPPTPAYRTMMIPPLGPAPACEQAPAPTEKAASPGCCHKQVFSFWTGFFN
jgi:hypothetical protein